MTDQVAVYWKLHIWDSNELDAWFECELKKGIEATLRTFQLYRNK